MLTSTNKHTSYWKNRKISWKEHYTDSVGHPHRGLITWMLRSIPFVSLWEVGIGGGANTLRILKDIPGKQLGGCDINEDAITLCRELFKNGIFHVESADDMMLSDKSIDVLLSDMTLIYVDPRHIDRYLKEFRRVTRNYIVLVEFHHRSWWKRQWARLFGYHVYDYVKRLEKAGFYDIMIQHIPEEYWPGTDNNTEFRSIITARA